MRTEFGTTAFANSIDWMFQIVEQLINRLSINCHVFLKRTIISGNTIDTTMAVITTRVSNIMLHMSNSHIGPIGHVQSTISAKFDISWTEILLTGNQ